MTVATRIRTDGGTPSAVAMVDPRAPRFCQAITALGLAVGIALQQPAFVYAMTAILCVSVLSNWRLDLYSLLWRRVLIPIVGPPAERDVAAPHRFAKLLGAMFTAVASLCLLAGNIAGIGLLGIVGYAVAAVVVVLAVAASVFDYCVGCKLYPQLSFVRRRGWV